MNELQLKYFNALREINHGLAKSLNDPRIKGVREVISNLYRDDAHFVYELLQNADDQGATYTKFYLSETELLFIHNAPRHFTITDPSTHETDRGEGTLGDVNSILSIASSSKGGRQGDVPIGKFGLGFKSVFLFTDEPEIYDQDFRFSISDYIVPNVLTNDHPRRGEDETLFCFKFKKGEEKDSYRKINAKLRGLINPLLFLNNLTTIEWETKENSGYYRIEETGNVGSGKQLNYEVVSDDEERIQEIWKFDSPLSYGNNLFVSVVYVLEDGNIATSVHPLYCYLPTANDTDLPVILHAPFKLTGNRESIIAEDSHNKRMITLLSDLLVTSLKEICEIGEKKQTPWIKDNILKFLPKRENSDEKTIGVKLDISSLSRDVLDALRTIPMLWSEQLGKYLISEQACIPDNRYLTEVYTVDLLGELFGVHKGWVLSKDIYGSPERLRLIGVEQITPDKILRRITPLFLNRRTDEWLKEWYKYLLNVPSFWEKGSDAFLRFQPIVKTSKDGVFVAPYVKGKESPNVCFSTPGLENEFGDDIHIIPGWLMEDEDVKSFFTRLGISAVNPSIIVEKVYLRKVNSSQLNLTERFRNLLWLIGIYNHNLMGNQQKNIKKQCMLPGYDSTGWNFYAPDSLKLHNSDNDFYFYGLDSIPFFEKDKLPMEVEDGADLIEEFIRGYESVHAPGVKYDRLSVYRFSEGRIPVDAQRPGYANRGKKEAEYFEEPVIEKFDYFLQHNAPTNPQRASELIERLFCEKHGVALYCSKYYNWNEYEIEPEYVTKLRKASWIDKASSSLRKWLGLPVRELQEDSLEVVKNRFLESGIVTREGVDNLFSFMEERGVLKDFQLKQSIEEQKTLVSSANKCSLRWFLEVLDLRLKYVESGEKDDVEFLINRLKNALNTINLEEDRDLREILPDNINIIFGPPGTGKTTEITRIISSKLEEDPEMNILILTPTNAAAKVIATRLNKMGIEAYRGVNPNNKDLCKELEDIDVPMYDSSIDDVPPLLIATVHYYTQTYSLSEGVYLHELDWDAIFVDETSMVTLDYVLFTLLKGNQTNPDCEFYLVGDPLQLPPITNLDPVILEEAQLDEFNFYSFIGLNQFSDELSENLKKLRDRIKITLLTDQYRSVPPLCEIMSRFSYNGKVKSKFQGSHLSLPDNVPSVFKQPFSIIRFPVEKDDAANDKISLSCLDKFKGSNYQIYSALLVKEMLQALFSNIETGEYDRKLTIGIITPYVAQKKLIEKLLNTNPISHRVNVEVFVNTVHQFQGDEFDIVLLLLNPPNITMEPKNKILINKRYLINVATSRAKNSLIILYPDESCNEKNFIHVNRKGDSNNIETIAEEVIMCKIGEVTIPSNAIEKELFGTENYLSGICEVSYHEDVNVHKSESDVKYRFVKGGDTIDILFSSMTDNPE